MSRPLRPLWPILLTVVAVATGGCGSDEAAVDRTPPPVPSPIPAPEVDENPGALTIPSGVLSIDDAASKPPPDPDMRWVRTDAANLTTHLSPCRTPLPSDADRIAGRQVVATPTDRALARGRPLLWKSVRLVVYRDEQAAARALAELREGLSRCSTFDDGAGVTTRWTSSPLPIGDEALFVGAQMSRDSTPLHGHYRGVGMRAGRAVMTYLDFGPSTDPPVKTETEDMQADARVMAKSLRAADWLR